MPPIRSVTLFLHDFSGVAYTKSSDLDQEHKELHLSTSYIADLPNRLGDKGVQNEIEGVLIHELTHVWQCDGNGHVPGWWIEGLADYVRLKEGLAAGHWREYPAGRKYDDSYEVRIDYPLEASSCSSTPSRLLLSSWLGWKIRTIRIATTPCPFRICGSKRRPLTRTN